MLTFDWLVVLLRYSRNLNDHKYSLRVVTDNAYFDYRSSDGRSLDAIAAIEPLKASETKCKLFYQELMAPLYSCCFLLIGNERKIVDFLAQKPRGCLQLLLK